MAETDKRTGANKNKAPIHVSHASLERSDCVLSGYRSKCPVCDKGVLLVRRSTTNMVLEPADNCLFCGQPFVYDDIESLRASDGFIKKLHQR